LNNVKNSFLNQLKYDDFSLQVNNGLGVQNDETLLFANSTMSTHKAEIISDSLPDNGLAISQKCLRMRSLAHFLDRSSDFGFNSYFTMVGMLFGGESSRDILNQTLTFLTSQGFDIRRLFIKTSSDCKNVNKSIVGFSEERIIQDSESESYYKWAYGIEGVVGEGITFAYLFPDGSYKDLGNIICVVDEVSGKIKAWESGFGVETLIAVRDGKDLFETHPIWDVLQYERNPDLKKVADSVVSVIEIIREGVLIGPKKQGYILKKFLNVIYYINKDLHLDLGKVVREYCVHMKYDNGEKVAETIISYLEQIESSKQKNLEAFKKFLKSNESLTEQQKIDIAKSSFSLESYEVKDLLELK
jgi:alanyl-tRNA synthetase